MFSIFLSLSLKEPWALQSVFEFPSYIVLVTRSKIDVQLCLLKNAFMAVDILTTFFIVAIGFFIVI